MLLPEAPRDRQRWGLSMNEWYAQVDILRSFITDNDWARMSIDRLCEEVQVTPEERMAYFGY